MNYMLVYSHFYETFNTVLKHIFNFLTLFYAKIYFIFPFVRIIQVSKVSKVEIHKPWVLEQYYPTYSPRSPPE